MNDFDRGARHAVKMEPEGTKQLLHPKMTPSLKYRRWLDSQSAPRPGEPDRRCDTIAELIDEKGRIPPHALVVELFTEPDSGAIDRSVEYVGRFRGELRHGPGGRDKYQFLVGLIFLTGVPAEVKLETKAPGMPGLGHWFRPAVVDFSEMDALAHLEATEQNRLPRGLLAWVPLMKGGQTEEVVRRWQALAEQDERVLTLASLAITFARLTDSVAVWKKGLEGIMLKTSPLWDEVRVETRLETRRQDTLDALEVQFPGAVPPSVAARINAETDPARLRKWLLLAVKADLAAIQADMA